MASVLMHLWLNRPMWTEELSITPRDKSLLFTNIYFHYSTELMFRLIISTKYNETAI